MKNLQRYFFNWIGGFIGLACSLVRIITFGTVILWWEVDYISWLFEHNLPGA